MRSKNRGQDVLNVLVAPCIPCTRAPVCRAPAFTAIAEMSSALAQARLVGQCGPAFEPCLPAISAVIRESIGLVKQKVRGHLVGDEGALGGRWGGTSQKVGGRLAGVEGVLVSC